MYWPGNSGRFGLGWWNCEPWPCSSDMFGGIVGYIAPCPWSSGRLTGGAPWPYSSGALGSGGGGGGGGVFVDWPCSSGRLGTAWRKAACPSSSAWLLGGGGDPVVPVAAETGDTSSTRAGLVVLSVLGDGLGGGKGPETVLLGNSGLP